MTPLQIAESKMIKAQVIANRYMRELTLQLDNQALWECWQLAEKQAKEAKDQWWAILKENSMKSNIINE